MLHGIPGHIIRLRFYFIQETFMNYANYLGYSDISPFEIVRRISDKTLEIRAMSAERDPSWKPDFVPNGFCGHISNQHDQRWFISSDPDRPVVRIRLGKQGWKDRNGRRFELSDKPRKFYDYNF
jgi:hypothetical protein